jgi:hypothetical protein
MRNKRKAKLVADINAKNVSGVDATVEELVVTVLT